MARIDEEMLDVSIIITLNNVSFRQIYCNWNSIPNIILLYSPVHVG